MKAKLRNPDCFEIQSKKYLPLIALIVFFSSVIFCLICVASFKILPAWIFLICLGPMVWAILVESESLTLDRGVRQIIRIRASIGTALSFSVKKLSFDQIQKLEVVKKSKRVQLEVV